MQARKNDKELTHLCDRLRQGADYLMVKDRILYCKVPNHISRTEEWMLPKDHA